MDGVSVEHEACSRMVQTHVAVNADTNEILSYVIVEPYFGDSLAFDRLMDTVIGDGHKVGKVLADATYDDEGHWRSMQDKEIEFIANIRVSVNPLKRIFCSWKYKGCAARAKHVQRILKVGREQWILDTDRDERWNPPLSNLKRMFSDTVWARARNRVSNMIAWTIRVHNAYKSIRASF